MNKKIVLLLTFFMLQQLWPTGITALVAGSTNDVKGTIYEKPVSRLNSLGIMVGDSGGFRPEDSIKRAEFAAVVVRAMGLEQSAEVFNKDTKFSDAPISHWASGYINVAVEIGIIKGTSATTFAPDDNVTYEQAIAMIIRALGYEEEALTNGGYPTGFIVMAHRLELLKGMPNFDKQTDPATRGMVGFMMDNALEIPMMAIEFYGMGNLQKQTVYGTYPQTLLEDKMRLKRYEGRVLDVKEGSNETKLVLLVTDSRNEADKGIKYEGAIPDYLIGVLNPVEHINAIVSVYELDKKIYGIRLESEVIYDYVQSINGETGASKLSGLKNFDDINEIRLKRLKETYSLKKTDNGSNDLYDSIKKSGSAGVSGISMPYDLLGKFVKVVIKNGDIVYLHAYDLSEGGRILDISDKTRIVYARVDKQNLLLVRPKENERLLVLLNGKAAVYNDIKTDYIFDYYIYEDTLILVVSSEIVEDKLASYSEKDDIVTVKVGEDYYDLSTLMPVYFSTNDGETINLDIGALDKLGGYKCTAYIDAKNEVRFLFGSTGNIITEKFYGVIVDYYTEDDNYLKIVRYNEDGSFKNTTVSVKDHATFEWAKAAKAKAAKTQPAYYQNDSKQFYVSYDNSDTDIIGLFEPDNNGRIIKITPLKNTGWVTNYPTENDTSNVNYLFPGYNPNMDVNPGLSVNRLRDINDNSNSAFRLYMPGSDNRQINYVRDNTKFLGFRWENDELIIEPVTLNQILSRRLTNLVGIKFHIKQDYDYATLLANQNPKYFADFVVVYGLDKLYSGDDMRYALFSGLERVSTDDYIGTIEQIDTWNNTVAERSVLINKDNIKAEDVINGGMVTITDKSFICYFSNQRSPVDTTTISVDDVIRPIQIARFEDIKNELKKSRNGQSSVAGQVYDIEEQIYFELSTGEQLVIGSGSTVYEYNPATEAFEYGNYKNISKYDYVLPIYMRSSWDNTESTRLGVVIFERRQR